MILTLKRSQVLPGDHVIGESGFMLHKLCTVLYNEIIMKSTEFLTWSSNFKKERLRGWRIKAVNFLSSFRRTNLSCAAATIRLNVLIFYNLQIVVILYAYSLLFFTPKILSSRRSSHFNRQVS